MKQMLVFAMWILFLVTGCSKQNSRDDASGVFVRIKNSTGQSFTNGQIAATEYGFLDVNSITDFKEMTEPIYAIGCLLTNKETQAFAAVLMCGTPMPPPISNGYYTLEIMPLVSDGYYPTTIITE